MDYFGEGEEFVRGDLDPASVVARGAALLARRYTPTDHAYDVHRRPDASLVDLEAQRDLDIRLITEHSLGVGVHGDRVVRLIERGLTLPTSHTKPDFTNPGPVEYVRAPVFQGEGETIYENTLIGEVVLGPMQPLATGSHHFEVTFVLDESGLLLVTVKHLETEKEYQAKFEHGTTVEGDDALEAMRGRLLNLYQPMSLAVEEPAAATTAPETPGSYAPPPPTGTATVEPAPVSAGAPAPEGAGQGAATAVAPAPEGAGQGAATAVAPAPADTAEEVVRPTVDVPDQFKQVVRRARKQLVKHADPDLQQAFNAFVSALNEGRPEEDLIELGDDLADAFDDARVRAR
jgi:hypothetical protein